MIEQTRANFINSMARHRWTGRSKIIMAAAAAVMISLPAAAARDRFGETVDVVTVEVPVQVVKGGAPVRGLTVDDFEIYDGKKRVPIEGLEVVDLGAIDAGTPAAERSALPVAARRHFMLLFDLTFAQPDGLVKARDAARQMVKSQLHASDLVAVATFTVNQGPKIVLGFTPDRAQVDSALDNLGLLQQVGTAISDPLGFVVSLDPVWTSAADTPEPGGGPLGGFAQASGREHFQDLVDEQRRADRSLAIDQVRAFTSSFEELARALGAVRGRKQVVLFSEGFDATAILGTASASRADETAREAAFGRYWKIDSDERFGSSSTLAFLDQMLSVFRRSDAVIQAVDIGGARTGASAEIAAASTGLQSANPTQGSTSKAENSLFVMANETGGELFRNFNDLGDAMSQLLERTSVTYLLTFTPKRLEEAGGYHPLTVKLTGGPRGARVVHRPGYFAAAAYGDLNALERQLHAADLVLDTADGGAIEMRAWAVPASSEGGRRDVLVFLDVDGASMLTAQTHDTARFRLFAYALDDRGSVGDFMTQSLALDLDRVEDKILSGGLVFYGRLQLPPGSFSVRTVLQDAYSGRYGAHTARVSVLPPSDPAPQLAPPLFALGDDDGLLLVENDSRHVAAEYPIAIGEMAFVPRAAARAASGLVPVMVAAFAGPDARLEAWLEDAQSQLLAGRVETVAQLDAAPDGILRARLTVDTGDLAAGDYRLRLRLTDGEVSAQSMARLVVGATP